MSLLHLKSVEQSLGKNSLIRAHKSYIVSIQKIESDENRAIISGSCRLAISRNYRDPSLTK